VPSCFPAGMLFYVSMFYPRDRTQLPMTAIVMGILVSQCVGAGMAAGLLSMDGLAGLAGWQWLFLIGEGRGHAAAVRCCLVTHVGRDRN